MNKWMKKWINGWTKRKGWRDEWWTKGQINRWTDQWMAGWVNEWINKHSIEWVSKWGSELMNDGMNEWTNKHWYTIKTKQGKHTSCSWILCSDNCDETACSSVELLVCITWPAGGIFPWSAAGKVTVTDTTVMLTLRLGILPARSCFSINSS